MRNRLCTLISSLADAQGSMVSLITEAGAVVVAAVRVLTGVAMLTGNPGWRRTISVPTGVSLLGDTTSGTMLRSCKSEVGVVVGGAGGGAKEDIKPWSRLSILLS